MIIRGTQHPTVHAAANVQPLKDTNMKDFIESIERGENITDAYRSPEQIAYRAKIKSARITQAICWSIVIILSVAFGAWGFIAGFLGVYVAAIGYDLGAKK